MSTVPEAIARAAHGTGGAGHIVHLERRAAGILPQPIVHDEVIATMQRIRSSFVALLEGIIERI
jgi:purine-nucleoside phosphorylase